MTTQVTGWSTFTGRAATALQDVLRDHASVKTRSRWNAMRHRTRMSTAGLRSLPGALVIGTMRGGTSSLYRYLGAHPLVVPSLRKETRFFSSSFPQGLAWYRAHFPLRASLAVRDSVRGGAALTFEATPDYLFDPTSAQRAAELLPTVSIIVLLRNPIDRAISHYNHMVRLGFEPLSFEEAIASEESRISEGLARLTANLPISDRAVFRHSYLTRGHYAEQLARWLKFFPRSQVLIIFSESFWSDPRTVFQTITDFLSLPRYTPRAFKNYSFVARAPQSSIREELIQSLQDYFEPHNAMLNELLEVELPWSNE